MSTELINEVK